MALSIFNHTSAGAPEYSLEPIDPLEIQKMEYTEPASDIVFEFENIKITGFKNQKLEDFQMNTDTKAVAYRMRVEVDIAADVSIKLNEATQNLFGTYKAKATSVEVVWHSYSLTVGSDGIEHYTIGPETISCEPVGVPEVIIDLQHSNTVAKDPDANAKRAGYLKKATEIKQKPVCTIITEAYKYVLAQFRTITDTEPKTAFFKDL
ncbi:unnamed protein product [Chilo suppressalis]|nr:unnamed protein product [Chilo suppressalis]